MTSTTTAKRHGRRTHRRLTSGVRRRNGRYARIDRLTGERIARGAVNRRVSTLLELVQTIQKQVASDVEVVTIVSWLVNSGAVVLTGNFAGQKI